MCSCEVPFKIYPSEDYSKILSGKKKNVLVYADPPYYEVNKDPKKRQYQIFFTHPEHIKFCAAMIETKHLWLLSYDSAPFIRSLYNDTWTNIEEVPNENRNHKPRMELFITKK